MKKRFSGLVLDKSGGNSIQRSPIYDVSFKPSVSDYSQSYVDSPGYCGLAFFHSGGAIPERPINAKEVRVNIDHKNQKSDEQ